MTQAAYTLELKADGRALFPAELRQRLGVQGGSRLIVRFKPDGHAELIPAAALAAELCGILAHDGPSLADELIADRREEARREEEE